MPPVAVTPPPPSSLEAPLPEVVPAEAVPPEPVALLLDASPLDALPVTALLAVAALPLAVEPPDAALDAPPLPVASVPPAPPENRGSSARLPQAKAKTPAAMTGTIPDDCTFSLAFALFGWDDQTVTEKVVAEITHSAASFIGRNASAHDDLAASRLTRRPHPV
jgi:hypothetical protein